MAVGIVRTPATWAIYAATGAWASFIYLTGPIAPVLAADIGISASSAGLVGTALAAGIASAALAGKISARIGRSATIRAGLAVLAAATVALAILPQLLTGWAAFSTVLVLVWIAATGGATALNTGTAELSDMHAEHSGTAITEANAAAAWIGLLSPLLLGAALGAGLGWWVGFALCLVLVLASLVGLVLTGRREPVHVPSARVHHTLTVDELYDSAEDPAPGQTELPKRLPGRFWVVMVTIFAAAGSEFAINFWGSPLIQASTGTATSTATAVMSASVAGMAVGRTLGSRVSSRFGAHRTLLGGFVLEMVGFFILWSAASLPIAVVGLIVAGLGISILFPLAIDRAITVANGMTDQAMSRVTLVLGLAIGGAPFALGALGAVMSVKTAMLLVPVLIGLGLVGVIASQPRPVHLT